MNICYISRYKEGECIFRFSLFCFLLCSQPLLFLISLRFAFLFSLCFSALKIPRFSLFYPSPQLSLPLTFPYAVFPVLVCIFSLTFSLALASDKFFLPCFSLKKEPPLWRFFCNRIVLADLLYV